MKLQTEQEWRKCHTLQLANAIIAQSGGSHTVFVGTTGSGKSNSLGTLLASMIGEGRIPPEEEPCNAFVFDPQNDLLPVISSMRSPLKVIVANILDSRSSAWDMAADIDSPAAATQFAFNAIPEGERSGDNNKFYDQAPRLIFATVLRELVNRGRPWTLRQAFLLSLEERYVRQLIATSRDPVVRMARVLLDDSQGETLANIRSALLTKLQDLALFAALAERATRRYSLKQLIKSDVTLHVGGDFQFPAIVGAYNYLILTMLKQHLVGQSPSRSRKHFVIVDEYEALNFGKPATEFLDLLVRGRSRGCQAVFVIHSPQQLADVYGDKKSAVLMGQAQNKLIFRVADYEGAEACSKLLGAVHRYEWTRTTNVAPSSHPGRNIDISYGAGETYASRPIIHPDEIMDLRLASLEHGIDGFGIVPTAFGTRKWKFALTPDWLAENTVGYDPRVRPYEACRRPAAQQHLDELSTTEVELFGLIALPRQS